MRNEVLITLKNTSTHHFTFIQHAHRINGLCHYASGFSAVSCADSERFLHSLFISSLLNRHFYNPYIDIILLNSPYADTRLSSRQCHRYFYCVLFLSCSVASRGDEFALCMTLTLQRSAVISTFPQPTRIQATYPPTVGCHINISSNSLSFLQSLPCLNICFNRKLLPILRSTPTFKLAIILLLAGDVSLNPGPAVKRNVRLILTRF